MGTKDLSKENLYESVKAIIESEEQHIHFDQHKLFTLFGIAFQYLLFLSTKKPGHYIIRLEDSILAEKLARKAKDDTTRKFITRLLLPRRLKYGQSTFFLDFFHPGSWHQTNNLGKDKIKAALIVKNTTNTPFQDKHIPFETSEEETTPEIENISFPEDWYYTSLRETITQTLVIAYEKEFPNSHPMRFSFIKKEKEKVADGVKISQEIDIDAIKDH